MAEYALSIRGLRKTYGRVVALDGLDIDVPRGIICGLIGPNGAGKTTTFGIVGGFIRADAGEVDILGDGPFNSTTHVGRLTLLPQDCELSPYTTVQQLLVYYGELQGMTRATARKHAERVLDQVALTDRGSFRIRQLSHGMRRRVAVAQALLGDPELVLLDEPVSGLDPELVVRMREIFVAQRGQRTLVISSHNLAELEAVCDHVIFLNAGKCVHSGTLEEITQRALVIQYELVEAITLDIAGFDLHWEGTQLQVSGESGRDAADINAVVIPAIMAAGGRLIQVRPGRSLEAAYMDQN